MQGFGNDPMNQGYGNGEQPKLEEGEQLWYVKYGVRTLGTFAGGCKNNNVIVVISLFTRTFVIVYYYSVSISWSNECYFQRVFTSMYALCYLANVSYIFTSNCT